MARDTADTTPIETATSSRRISNRAASRAKSGGSARSTRNSASTRTATARSPMRGRRGIRALLEGMQALLGWEPIHDGENIIGLVDPIGGGGDLARARRAVRALRRAAEIDPPDLPRGACASGAGAPDRRPARHRLPRPRHEPEMEALRDAGHAEVALQDHGGLHAEGRRARPRHDVPHLHGAGEPRFFRAKPTCATSFASGWRCSRSRPRSSPTRPSPRTARTASSRIRSEIWRDTDPHRTGMLPFAFLDGFGFESYVDWALDVPMYFVVRDGRYHDMTAFTFRQFMAGMAPDDLPEPDADHGRLEEPSLHALSRGSAQDLSGDARRRRRALAAARARCRRCGSAFFTTRRRSTRRRSSSQTWTAEERQALRDDVPRTALATPFRNRTVLDIAKEVVAISRAMA